MSGASGCASGADALAFASGVDSLRLAARIPGLAVVVLRDTTVILARGFGMADLERRTEVTAETPFNIASVTKPISATLALRLVAQGALDLDAPMSGFRDWSEFCRDARAAGGIFFGDLSCTSGTLTLRHLLSMRANGVPGTRFFYNPPLFSWTSRPMMERTGVAYSDLMDSLIFKPAAMQGAARINRDRPLSADLAARLARPYHVDAEGRVSPSEPPGPQGDGAAGGVIASAMDLAHFDIALSDGRLLSDAARESMWTEPPYGLGWFVQSIDGERVVWHSGLWEGAYSALYLKVPERRLTLILLANSDGLAWDNALDEAAVERSPFAALFLRSFSP